MESKQVLIWRHDLKVRKGKIAAQIAHASLGAVLSVLDRTGDDNWTLPVGKFPALKTWLEGRFTKICTYCNSEEELLELYEQAKKAGLICSLITDAGLTEFNGVPTKTCLAIGPGNPEEIDKITKHLNLL
jgi:PTH2 family peptidyl-tRNA hydrolase